MALDENGDLAIAQLAFWVPALLLSICVCIKHGFNRQSGWVFIAILGICRIIGASCLIVYETQSDKDDSLLTAAAITDSLGISFLLSALIGLQTRVFQNMANSQMAGARFVQALYLLILVGIILSIIGAVDVSNNPVNSHKENLGYDYLKASTILYLIAFVVLCVMTIFALFNTKLVLNGQQSLLVAEAASLPFVFVRLLYAIIAVFARSSSFNLFHPYIWTEAFMETLEEFIVSIIIVAAGFATSKPEKMPLA